MDGLEVNKQQVWIFAWTIPLNHVEIRTCNTSFQAFLQLYVIFISSTYNHTCTQTKVILFLLRKISTYANDTRQRVQIRSSALFANLEKNMNSASIITEIHPGYDRLRIHLFLARIPYVQEAKKWLLNEISIKDTHVLHQGWSWQSLLIQSPQGLCHPSALSSSTVTRSIKTTRFSLYRRTRIVICQQRASLKESLTIRRMSMFWETDRGRGPAATMYSYTQ